jgi:hypothetical protein
VASGLVRGLGFGGAAIAAPADIPSVRYIRNSG